MVAMAAVLMAVAVGVCQSVLALCIDVVPLAVTDMKETTWEDVLTRPEICSVKMAGYYGGHGGELIANAHTTSGDITAKIPFAIV